MPLASLSGSITSAVGNHGIYAVFGLLVVAALVPVASELVMLGSAIFCFGLTAAGWALGTAYTHAHHDLRYADYVVGAGVFALAAYLLYRWVRAARVTRGADDPAR